MSLLVEFDDGLGPTNSDAFGYRLRAAKLGRLARDEKDNAKMLILLHEALAWIELAQNEELLATANGPHQLQ